MASISTDKSGKPVSQIVHLISLQLCCTKTNWHDVSWWQRCQSAPVIGVVDPKRMLACETREVLSGHPVQASTA